MFTSVWADEPLVPNYRLIAACVYWQSAALYPWCKSTSQEGGNFGLVRTHLACPAVSVQGVSGCWTVSEITSSGAPHWSGSNSSPNSSRYELISPSRWHQPCADLIRGVQLLCSSVCCVTGGWFHIVWFFETVLFSLLLKHFIPER